MLLRAAFLAATVLSRRTLAFQPIPAVVSKVGTTLHMSTSAGEPKRVLVPIADDSEEIETACITGKSQGPSFVFCLHVMK